MPALGAGEADASAPHPLRRRQSRRLRSLPAPSSLRSCGLLPRSVDEQRDELLEADARPPAEAFTSLRRVADELVVLAALERLVDAHVFAPVEPGMREGELD